MKGASRGEGQSEHRGEHQGKRLCEVGEVGLIARLQQRLKTPVQARGGRVVLGIGDDAAVLQALTPLAVVTADMLVEGVDFERRWATPQDIGHKAAAVNLSDLAAMGARPRGLLASVAVHPNDRVADVVNLLVSLHRTGATYGAPLVGGDISRTTGPWVVAVTAMGDVQAKHVLRRSAGHPGDLLCVTGRLGAAAAGLIQLQSGTSQLGALVRRQLRPTPQIAVGRAFARAGCVRSVADISDGLIKDAVHVARPGAGVQIELAALPLAYGLCKVAQCVGQQPWQLALCGGEDFELVVAVPPKHLARAKRCAQKLSQLLTVVGQITRAPGVHLLGAPQGSIPAGFDHFKHSLC